ncbi:hypothetical protein [Hydrogenophaga sp.]|uniref:hypothetical protein n=1 Tax=Hydrogenophaga sp. TaxID=1904254 RepID=UPI0027162CDE|nr:hypothetical protein [Hydrogenophaga sp.]MDO9437615.1 hypothetical protein [Hydrogenophaga sp.]
MRHLLLALMIALLPLRGWMGDAMAVAMVTAPAHAAMANAAPCPDHAAMPAPSAPTAANAANAVEASHTGMAHGQDAAHSDDSAADGHTHKSCEVCNGPAMALTTPVVPLPAATHGMLAFPAERFASAEPQQHIKPPIS